MPWKRRGDRQYFYRSRRVGGRVVTEYVGTGTLGERAAAEIECDRESCVAARAAEQQRGREEREWQDKVDRVVSETCGLAAWIMQAAGYHRHDRGPWRKRRGMMSQGGDPAEGEGMVEGSSATVPAGRSPAAKPARRPAVPLGRGPDRTALRMLAEHYCGADAAGRRSRERLVAEAEEMARELAGPDPTPLVMVLAETAALAWAELRLSQASVHAAGQRSIAQADEAGRRIDRAHRRFLRAAKVLSDVQRVSPKLLVQINQQYNLSSDVPRLPGSVEPEGG